MVFIGRARVSTTFVGHRGSLGAPAGARGTPGMSEGGAGILGAEILALPLPQGDAVPMGQSLAFKISVRSVQPCTKNVQLVFSLPAKQGQRSLLVPVEHLPLSHSSIQQPQLSLALKSFFLQEPEAGAVIARS